ncbi:kynurenine formamidase [Tumebacillus sp. BK434]|uniref:arylformamidase n=1 Tax=Tumebacillus sp. BK434 TaxID=2512169 RepID=UPI001047B9D8|nr:arylformamidase [Tumebacillus sp. BK434]TCP57662.1 kynurenine formamidase [Tumebacillus sp. BK434]
MKIYDITMPVSEQTAPFPGDTPFGQEWVLTMREGGSCNVSKITMSPHLGTHADAPYHYHDEGATTEQADLNLYIGAALVVAVPPMPLVTLAFVQKLELNGVERLLFHTGSSPDPHVFCTDFTAIAPEAASYLAGQGVRLVGIDTPSVDPADSKTLDAHNAFFKSGLHILENLRLDGVPPGRYELIALPLHLVGSDASPVRAILRQL